MKAFLIVSLFCSVTVCHLNAQDIGPIVVAAAGESYQGTTIQLDWTLGEPLTTNFQNSNLIITQGFHQSALVISSISAIPEENQISIYPNPSTDRISIKVDKETPTKIKLQLINNEGKLMKQVQRELLGKEKIELDLEQLPAGQYYLHFIFDESQHPQMYTIQKIR